MSVCVFVCVCVYVCVCVCMFVLFSAIRFHHKFVESNRLPWQKHGVFWGFRGALYRESRMYCASITCQ